MSWIPWPEHDACAPATPHEHTSAFLARHAMRVAECTRPGSLPFVDLSLERSILATMASGYSAPVDPDHFADPAHRIFAIALAACLAHDHEPTPGYLERVLVDLDAHHLVPPGYCEWVVCGVPARLPLERDVAKLAELARKRDVHRLAVALACVAADTEATREELAGALVAVAGALREC